MLICCPRNRSSSPVLLVPRKQEAYYQVSTILYNDKKILRTLSKTVEMLSMAFNFVQLPRRTCSVPTNRKTNPAAGLTDDGVLAEKRVVPGYSFLKANVPPPWFMVNAGCAASNSMRTPASSNLNTPLLTATRAKAGWPVA